MSSFTILRSASVTRFERAGSLSPNRRASNDTGSAARQRALRIREDRGVELRGLLGVLRVPEMRVDLRARLRCHDHRSLLLSSCLEAWTRADSPAAGAEVVPGRRGDQPATVSPTFPQP